MLSYPPEVLEAIIVAQDRFAWEAASFPKYQRGKRWYLIMTLVAVFLVAYAVYTSNFLFAFFLLLSAILLILAGVQQPSLMLVQIGDHGVVVGGRFYPFQELREFALVYQPPYSKVLYIEQGSSLRPRLRIPLEDEDPVAIREHLRQYLPENLDLQGEHVSDIFARLLRI